MLQQNDFLISYVLTWLVLSILAGPVIVFFCFPIFTDVALRSCVNKFTNTCFFCQV
jgi:hypothetical protein